MDEFMYTQEDIDEWARTCDELQERNRELKEELCEARGEAVKEVLEKVWDATFDKEVGMRWKLLQIAEEYGVKLDRRLKKYGERRTNKPV